MRRARLSFDSSKMRDLITTAVAGLEYTLSFVGAVVLWRYVLSPAARLAQRPPRLTPWNAPLTDFLFFLLYVVGGSFMAALIAGLLVKHLPLRGDAVTVFNGAAAQLGMLAGFLSYRQAAHRIQAEPVEPGASVFATGAATFLLALPLLIATAKAWEIFLRLSGLPTGRQDLIGMFANAKSPWLIAIMILLAVVIAPLTEELVFRAGIYRYFRTRMPRWIALLVPSMFFATLHVNWETLQGLASFAPLTVLAIVFSLAYERTGRIGTSIVAHALFNLNTVVVIFSGVDV